MNSDCPKCGAIQIHVTDHPDYHDGEYCMKCEPEVFTSCSHCLYLQKVARDVLRNVKTLHGQYDADLVVAGYRDALLRIAGYTGEFHACQDD